MSIRNKAPHLSLFDITQWGVDCVVTEEEL